MVLVEGTAKIHLRSLYVASISTWFVSPLQPWSLPEPRPVFQTPLWACQPASTKSLFTSVQCAWDEFHHPSPTAPQPVLALYPHPSPRCIVKALDQKYRCPDFL